MENEKRLSTQMESAKGAKSMTRSVQLIFVLLKNEKIGLRIVDVEKAYNAMQGD